MTETPRRRLLLRLVVTPIAVAVALGILEIVVRAIPLYPDTFAVGDATLGWRYRPDASGTWFNVGCPREFTNFVQLNDRGAHDVNHETEKTAGTKRVLVIGDSIVASLEVPLEDTFFRRMDGMLNMDSIRHDEVIAFGVASYGTAQEWLYYTVEGRTYAPDLVLLVFTPHNDFDDNHPAFMELSVDWYYTRPFFHLDDAGQLVEDAPRGAPMPPLHRLLLEHSALYRLLSVIYREHRPPVSLFGTEYEAARAESWQITFAELAALRDAIAADGKRFGVVIDQGHGMAADERLAIHAEIEKGLDERGIPWLSLLQPFNDAEAQGTTVRYACDSHWTPEGHAVAAEAITPFMESLLAAPPADAASG